MNKAKGKIKIGINKSVGIIAIIVIWALISGIGTVSDSLMPSPLTVLKRLIELFTNGTMGKHVLVSMVRVIKGFLIALGLALPIGLIIGTSKPIRRALDPLIELFRPIPPTAMISLSILWFGIGEASKVFIIAWASFFPILLNVVGGVQQVEKIHILAAKTLGANMFDIFVDVILRSAVPNIVIGMRSGFSMAFISLVAAELIASTSGIGYFIQDARYMYRIVDVFVGIIVIGFIGFVLNQVLLKLEKSLITWK
ncbi:MAG: ABC transporter permease [Lachnospiraceae bacterium]|nr:ABC transporter permease [Lachnospiraceae bacterium]